MAVGEPRRGGLPLGDALAVDRTTLANERTLLAYVRSALQCGVAGVSLLKFFDDRRTATLGWALVAVALVLVVVGAALFARRRERLARAGTRAAAEREDERGARRDLHQPRERVMRTVSHLWLAALVVGALIPVQAAANAALSRSLAGHPTFVAAVLFAVAAAVTLVALAASGRGVPDAAALRAAPWWSYAGGLIVATYVLAITVLAGRLGVGTAIALIVTGQILAALAIDQFGLVGARVVPLTPARALGAGLMVAGAFLALRR